MPLEAPVLLVFVASQGGQAHQVQLEFKEGQDQDPLYKDHQDHLEEGDGQDLPVGLVLKVQQVRSY